MSRVDQYNVTVSIDGVSYGTWDHLTGGDIDSVETKYAPGGMAPQVSLGGKQEVANVTLERLYDLTRDHTTVPTLRSKVGKGAVTVSKQPLDVDGNAFGSPIVYKGKLKKLGLPDANSESSEAAKIQLEVSVATVA